MVVNVYNSSGFVKVYDYTKIDYICDNFKYFDPRSDFNESHNIYFFTITVSDKLVGIAHIRKNPYIYNTYWLSYLSVIKNKQNSGYATILSDYIFKWFKEKDLQFETSSYSNDGWDKLKPLFNKLSKKHGVKFIDKETRI